MRIVAVEELRFLWKATRGYRLRPWRSPYLRWRIETFSGIKAEDLTGKGMLAIVWGQRTQFLRFLRWTGKIRSLSNETEKKPR